MDKMAAQRVRAWKCASLGAKCSMRNGDVNAGMDSVMKSDEQLKKLSNF